MKRINFTLLLLLSIHVLSFSQYNGNIEDRRMHTDSVRFVLNENLAFAYFNNDGKYFYQVGNNLGAQFKTKDLKSIFLLLADYSLVRTEGQDFQNAWFIHLRYNRKWSKLFRTEVFVQNQRDKVLDVTNRNLLGIGIRFKLISKDNFNLYWGNTYMYENERSDFIDGSFKDHRYSTYLSTSFDIHVFDALLKNGKTKAYNISVVNTFYYQPLFNNFDDYRILEQFKITVPFTDKFDMYTYFNYFKDSVTPLDRDQFRTQIFFGLGFDI